MAFQTLLPLFVYFLIGLLLRLLGVANRDQATFLFRIVYFVALPALVFPAIAGAELNRRTILLPVAGVTVTLLCAAAAIFYVLLTKLDNRRAGVVVLGASINNMVLSFPFILSVLGPTALADVILYDLGVLIFLGTIAYSISVYFDKTQGFSVTSVLFKTLRVPVFIAFAAALLVNALEVPVPAIADDILLPLGSAITPLVLIAVGVSFSTKGISNHLTFVTVLLRMLLGLMLGILIVWMFGFEDVTAAVVVVLAAAPIGFSSATLASIGNLDTEQAGAALWVSLAIGVFTTPLLLLTAAHWLGV